MPEDPLILNALLEEVHHSDQIQSKLNAIQTVILQTEAEGKHHKQWVLDQILQITMGDEYSEFIKHYEWDKGIAP